MSRKRIEIEVVHKQVFKCMAFLKTYWPLLSISQSGDILIIKNKSRKVLENIWTSLCRNDPKWLNTAHYFKDEKEFLVEFLCGRGGIDREDLSKLPKLSTSPAYIWSLYKK